MSVDHAPDVTSAFDILLQEIAAAIDALQEQGAEAFARGDTGAARELADRMDAMRALRERAAELQREWDRIGPPAKRPARGRVQQARTRYQHLPNGQRTPEEAYVRPILETLLRMGGSGKVDAVLRAVGESMRPILREVDLQPLSSDPRQPRWRNTAQWARLTMVRAGLLADDSPRGVWEITDKGRAWLQDSDMP